MEKSLHQSSSYSSTLLFEALQKSENIITYLDELGNKKTITDQILKINKEELHEEVVLANGQHIRLDLIYSVDDEISPYYSEDYFKCDCV